MRSICKSDACPGALISIRIACGRAPAKKYLNPTHQRTPDPRSTFMASIESPGIIW